MFSCLFRQWKGDQRGTMLVLILVFGAVAFTIIITGVASYGLFESRASNRVYARDTAFHIAEAGVNYYRWHLAHAPTDYQDGTGQPGPYVHQFYDKDGNHIGYFSLEIDPPLSGTTVVTVRSTGWTVWQPDSRRTVQVRLGFPGLTDYTFLENANMRFSPTTVVRGQVHSNGGIEFNGTTDAPVRSARDTYDSGCCGTKPGVWGSGGPTEFWEYPVPAVDFFGITADLANIRDMAMNGGIHLTSSGASGWHLVFQNDGTFDLYRVTSRWCYWTFWGWACYDIGNETFVQTYTIPANGAIFVEDRTWVEGVVDGRVTVGAGRFPVQPSTYQDLIIADNLTYEQQASDDVIGLIAQDDIIVPRNVPNDMTIEAAALAQFGQIIRPGYWYHTRNSLTFFGSQISYAGGGWKYGTPPISGFIYTNHLYDGNLRYYPPPGFPVGNTYELISWEELSN